MLPKLSFTVLTVLLTLTPVGSASARTGDVVYLAQTENSGPVELFHVDAKSGTVTKLNGALAEGGNVTAFVLGPRGRQLVYQADQETDDVFELYHVRLDKKNLADVQQTKLNGDLGADGDVFEFALGPKGRQLVYLADQDADQVFELYHVSLDKKNLADVQQTKLNGDLSDDGSVFGFEFESKGRQLVYRADQDVDFVFELYQVDLSMKSLLDVMAVRLYATIADSGVGAFSITPSQSVDKPPFRRVITLRTRSRRGFAAAPP